MTGLDAILERQARQLKTIGIALLVLAAVSACAAMYLTIVPDDSTLNQFYGISGLIVFGGLGVAAIRRARYVEIELAEQRRTGGLPTATAHERR